MALLLATATCYCYWLLLYWLAGTRLIDANNKKEQPKNESRKLWNQKKLSRKEQERKETKRNESSIMHHMSSRWSSVDVAVAGAPEDPWNVAPWRCSQWSWFSYFVFSSCFASCTSFFLNWRFFTGESSSAASSSFLNCSAWHCCCFVELLRLTSEWWIDDAVRWIEKKKKIMEQSIETIYTHSEREQSKWNNL